MIKILAIETSCDETAAAVVENEVILSNVISSSVDLHSEYGGVVPEIAARAHIEAVLPVVKESLTRAQTNWEEIDAIAVTEGPGLSGSLLVGVNTAKTLANLKNKPLIPVHHVAGHIYSGFAEHIKNGKQPSFPLLALVVSGGHTSLILMRNHLEFETVGKTIDDAAGEVFDKVAKILDLGYPGGPIVSKLAETGNKEAFNFPRVDLTPAPKRDASGYLVQPEPSLNFSFSGLKTAVLNEIRKSPKIKDNDIEVANVCASFQQTVIDILARNTANAVNLYKPRSVVLCGGVAANKELRNQLEELVHSRKIDFFVPELKLTGDNAAMIAIAAIYKFKTKKNWPWDQVSADPNLKL